MIFLLTDAEISQNANKEVITKIANKIGLNEDDIELYGNYKAKIKLHVQDKLKNKNNGKLILVTAINPTPAGEGKTTVTIGLGQALNKLNKKVVLALREPSLGPVMGLKGGACGGGYSQVVPMDDINLHFTGDIHAITAANNLIAAAIDNHIYFGNELKIEKVIHKRAMDINDRALRYIELTDRNGNVVRRDNFIITVATEIMAILCLANDVEDLKRRIGKIIIGFNKDEQPIMVKDLKIEGAVTALLKDAIKPNLVQTLENVPCIIHGGPFANIAHGCNSIIATKLALKLGDYVVTEAGFGADLGAEKFFDIKCRKAGLKPDAVVLVTTIRSLKYNAGVQLKDITTKNIEALEKGAVNLVKHIENIKKYKVPVVVTVNKFFTDTEEEINVIKKICKEQNVECSVSEVFEHGGNAGIELARALIKVFEEQKSEFEPLYDEKLSIKEKIKEIATKIYGADNVVYADVAEEQIVLLEKLNLDKMPVCIAKTQYSLSDNPSLLGRPTGFDIHIKNVSVSNGAEFIVVLTGDIMTMPGLPRVPAAEKIDVSGDGIITGIF